MEALALQYAISFHIFIVFILIIIVLINIVLMLAIRDFVKLHKFMWFLTPIFFGFLGIALLSGISIAAMMGFNIRVIDYCMLLLNILIITMEIYRIKKLRYTRKNNHFLKKYIFISKALYGFYLCGILIIYYLA